MKKVREGYKEYEFGVIPNDWQVKKLGDIFNDLKGGSTPSRLIDRYYTGDIPWITSGELKYKTIYNTLESITEEAVKDTNLKLYPQGTFFIAITGLEAEGTRGSCAITGVPATTNQSCLAFQPKEGFSNLYLYHWYRLYGNYIGLKYTQGTKQQSLNNKIVGKLEIPVPKLEEQEKIASILSTVDEQIDNVDALIEKNKELKKGLMQTLLTKGIGHTKFKKTEIGEIPEEWEVVTLGNISRNKGEYGIGASASEFIEGKARYLRITDIGDECNLLFNDIKGLNDNEYEKYLLSIGDVVFARTGNTTGKSYVYEENHGELVYAGFLIKFSINLDICKSNFIKYVIQTKRYWDWVAVMSTRSGQPGINSNEYSGFLVQLPPIEEQEKIASILSKVDKKIEEYKNKKQKLENLKKGLMQQLLTGKIRAI